MRILRLDPTTIEAAETIHAILEGAEDAEEIAARDLLWRAIKRYDKERQRECWMEDGEE